MTCKEFRALLTDHHGNELVAEVRARFDFHKGECPNCGYFLDSFTVTVKLSRLLPRAMPPGLEERLRARVEQALAKSEGETTPAPG